MIINFDPKILYKYFSTKTRESCKSCKRYSQKCCCPPFIKDMVYYQLLLPCYRFGILVIEEFKIDNPKNWQQLGKSSSLVMAKQLYLLRNELTNYTYVKLFGAGSCKFCSDICKPPCKHPDKMLIPLEATGLNIVKLVKDLVGLELVFPVKDKFYRIGAMLWDGLDEE